MKYGRHENLTIYLIDYPGYKQITIEKWKKGCILPFFPKSVLGIS